MWVFQEKTIIFLELCVAFPAQVRELARELNGEYHLSMPLLMYIDIEYIIIYLYYVSARQRWCTGTYSQAPELMYIKPRVCNGWDPNKTGPFLNLGRKAVWRGWVKIKVEECFIRWFLASPTFHQYVDSSEPNSLKRTLTPKGRVYCQSHMTGSHMREVIRSRIKSYRKREEAPCFPQW